MNIRNINPGNRELTMNEHIITLNKELIPTVPHEFREGIWLPDLEKTEISIPKSVLLPPNSKTPVTNKIAKNQNRPHTIELTHIELDVYDFIMGMDSALGKTLQKNLPPIEQFRLEYSRIFAFQWFRENNSKAYDILLD